MIYTTYFGKLKKLPKTIVPVSIALNNPKGYNGFSLISLAPTKYLLNHWKIYHDDEYYTMRYKEKLETLDVAEITAFINGFNPGGDVALVCYEKPADFCHRHIVRNWLNQNGIACEEWIG